MTVNYDARDHLGIIFRIHGSVLPQVLPWCAWNVAVSCLIRFLRLTGTCNLTFKGGLGYSYISVLVSFFVVSNVNTAYSRLWEARTWLGKGLYAITQLAVMVALFSGKETHEKAKLWRKILRIRIASLLKVTMFIIQHNRASVINARRKKMGWYKHHMYKSSSVEITGIDPVGKVLIKETTFDAARAHPGGQHVMTYFFAVDAAIRSHADFLESPLLIAEQMDLLGKTSIFMDAYSELLKNSTTPRSFATVQMGRTLLLVWILSLPFALGGTTPDSTAGWFEQVFLILLVTYGFVGLMFAEIEMHDPLGSDANDLETDKYTAVVLETVEEYLREDADHSAGFDFQPEILYNQSSPFSPSTGLQKSYNAV